MVTPDGKDGHARSIGATCGPSPTRRQEATFRGVASHRVRSPIAGSATRKPDRPEWPLSGADIKKLMAPAQPFVLSFRCFRCNDRYPLEFMYCWLATLLLRWSSAAAQRATPHSSGGIERRIHSRPGNGFTGASTSAAVTSPPTANT